MNEGHSVESDTTAATRVVAPAQSTAEKPRRARILLIDDHAILREGLSTLIELESDMHVVGQAGSVADGVAVAQSIDPDLIVTDISLPGATGVQGIIELRQRCPRARLLVLTVHSTEEYLRAALSAGADGYVLKDATRAELIHALRAVLAGQRHLCPRSSAYVMRTYLGEQPAARNFVACSAVILPASRAFWMASVCWAKRKVLKSTRDLPCAAATSAGVSSAFNSAVSWSSVRPRN